MLAHRVGSAFGFVGLVLNCQSIKAAQKMAGSGGGVGPICRLALLVAAGCEKKVCKQELDADKKFYNMLAHHCQAKQHNEIPH